MANPFGPRTRVRHATDAEWAAANPTPHLGEVAYSTDSRRFKVGNGVNNWAALPYAEGGVSTGVAAHEAASDPHPQYQKESEKGAANGYASLDAGATVPDAQIPAAIARDAEVTAAIAAHVALADPHVQYQKESEKSAANGYASLDAGGKVPDGELPAGLARDAEVTAAIATHEAAGDPHTGYQKESEKGVANGYASLDSGGKVPDSEIPAAIARDSEVTAAVAAHEAASDPHAQYAKKAGATFTGELVMSAGIDIKLGNAAQVSTQTTPTHALAIKDSTGAVYYLFAATVP